MFTKQGVFPQDENAIEIDEGWWTSVLSTEIEEYPANERCGIYPTDTAVAEIIDWSRVRTLYDQDEIISLEVYGWNRGGLLVRGEQIQGFVPISHLVEISISGSEEDYHQQLAGYLGNTLKLKVIECEPVHDRVVLSERAAQSAEGRRKQLFNTLKTGDIVSGNVTNVTNFGAFVDLGGLEGLIHVSELSWGRVENPSQVIKVDQKVDAVVLQVCVETARVALSLKRLQPNPWEAVVQRYQPGDVVAARITSTTRFGAFARLDEGIEGLIHVSSISSVTGSKAIDNVIRIGQVVKVQILHIDPDRRRLGLSLVGLE
jgi:small subunit ribosomal protein S1